MVLVKLKKSKNQLGLAWTQPIHSYAIFMGNMYKKNYEKNLRSLSRIFEFF